MKEFLKDVFLFNGMDDEKIDEALETIDPIIVEYSKKDEIYSKFSREQRLGFVVSGECKVERIKHDGLPVPLNVMKSGNSFGVISVFSSEDEFPTIITATKDTRIIYITKSDTEKLIRNYPEIALNVIKFLSKKIIFLNRKVATFSEDTVESKLASFLSDEYTKYGAEFVFNCKRSAEAISVGRASLYRAISSLSDEGIIKLENKKIIILDHEGLERKTK